MGHITLSRKIKSTFKTLYLIFRHWRDSLKLNNTYTPVFDNTAGINKGDIVVILVIKDEADRVPYFLDYYYRLGIDRFIILDNDSTDDLIDVLIDNPTISLFRISQSYSDSKYGITWINYFARKYCLGNWVLSVDSDEFLVFPHCDTRNIKKLCGHLEDIESKVFFAPMIDMYSDKAVMDTVYSRGDDPLIACPYFDGSGYFKVLGGLGDVYIRGGVRMRIFQDGSPKTAPALNKYPLIKWDALTFYHCGAHVVLPKRKNKVATNKKQISGALLHFKFFSDLYQKAEYAVKHGNHYNNSAEYKNYLKQLNLLSDPLVYNGTLKYKGIHTLVEHNLVQSGDWI